MNKVLIILLALGYMGVMGFFAFRPFKPIRGLQYARADVALNDGAVHVQRDAALEDRKNGDRIREALVKSGQLSLAVTLQTDSLNQLGSANILGFARSNMVRNFTLGQEGNALEFHLRTTRTDDGGLRYCLTVPQVFETNKVQRILITYDGSVRSLYLDGRLLDESRELRGSFDNWGIDHTLLIGDLPPGGDGWAGRIWNIALYDRVLTGAEAGRLARSEAVEDAILAYDFGQVDRAAQLKSIGLRPLHYRNLFITYDETAYDLDDCIFNIAGFVPLGLFIYLLLPTRMERRKLVAAILVPLLLGGLVSFTIEFLQRFVLGRVPCAPDLVYNITGSLMGGLLGWLVMSNFKNKTTDGSTA